MKIFSSKYGCWKEIDLLNYPRFLKFSMTHYEFCFSFPAFDLDITLKDVNYFFNPREIDKIMDTLSKIAKQSKRKEVKKQ